jgi:flagellar motility protein MotE (MotC chaperone)/sporulation protein YlmC with PRC-barrel domain
MLFFSQLQGLPVVDSAGRRLARLRDLSLSKERALPHVQGLVARSGFRHRWMIPWELVERLDHDRVTLRAGASLAELPPPDERERLLGEDLLDCQVVDVNGAKVVRVNDVQLASHGTQVIVIGVDIGPWGLARRLGIAELVAALSNLFQFRMPEGIVPWDVIEPLDRGQTEVQLKVARDRLTRLHPADLADIFQDLGYEQRTQLLAELDDAQVADVLEEMEPDEAADILVEMPEERAADVLEEMEPDEAADVLGELSETRAEQLIGLMEADEAEEVRELLSHPEDSAGSLMTPHYVALPARTTVSEAIAACQALDQEVESLAYVYLVDEEGKLEGVVSLRELMVAEADLTLGEMSPSVTHHVAVTDDQEEVLRLLIRYGFQSVPVVSEGDRLVGVVTWLDAVYPLVPEHLR